MKSTMVRTGWAIALIAGLCGAASLQAVDLATVSGDPAALRFLDRGDHSGLMLRVSGPEGLAMTQRVAAGEMAVVEMAGLADGEYTYELRPLVELPKGVADAARAAREAGDTGILMALRRSGDLPTVDVQSGYFRVLGGALVPMDEVEPVNRPQTPVTRNGASGGNVLNTLDFVIADDLIVDGSACIGFDCVNGESFGFDTIRLKENNLRIKFQDTSASASFPSRDWQLTANDTANGGANKFSIDDIDGSRTPFTIEAGAPSHSLYVDDGGRLGLGTSTPVSDIHAVSGNTPTLRLEQDGSSGFAPQTWDVAANETNFFVRDASNGSTLPLRIRPSAPSNSVYIDGNGEVGMGTASPTDANLHVLETAAGAKDVLRLENNGVTRLRMVDSSSGNNWQIRVGGTSMNLTKDGTGGNEFEILDDGSVNIGPGGAATFALDALGNLDVVSLTETSDRNAKRDIMPVDNSDILERVSDLPISTWYYKNDPRDAQHLGPMAQDFARLFGLGQSDRKIRSLDVGGVALASIQALHAELEAKQAELEELEARNSELEERLEAQNRSFEERLQAIESRLDDR